MKKLLLILTVLAGLSLSASAGRLAEAFGRVKTIKGMELLDNKQQTDSLLHELHSSLPFTTAQSAVSPFEKGSEGVTDAWNGLRSTIGNLNGVNTMVAVENDYNDFILFAEPSAESGKSDLLAIWQLNYFGQTVVIYGQVNSSDLPLIDMGSLQMNHFGISFNPMPREYYQKLMELSDLQQELNADGKNLDKQQHRQLLRRYHRNLMRLNPQFASPYTD